MDSTGKIIVCCLFGVLVGLQGYKAQVSDQPLHREGRQTYTTPPPCPHGEVHDLLKQGRDICRTCWMGCCRTCNNEEHCTAFLDIFFIEAFQQCMTSSYNSYQIQKCCDARGNLESLLNQLQRMCSGRSRTYAPAPA